MQVTWFGKQYDAPIYYDTTQAPTPVDVACMYCDELILMGEDGFLDSGSNPFHRECWVRMLIGSVAHQRHLCTCYMPEGAAQPHEPEGLSRRQTAKLAVAYHEGTIED